MVVRKRSRSVARRGVRGFKKSNMRKRRYVKKQGWRAKTVKRMADVDKTATLCKYDRLTATTITNMPQGYMVYVDMTDVKGVLVTDGFTDSGIKPNRRLSNNIDMRGWKYQLHVQNKSKTPQIFHYAMVRSRRTDSQVFSFTDFFRDYNDSRDLDFNAGLFAQNYHNLPINPEAYDVLFHKRTNIPGIALQSVDWLAGSAKDQNWRKLAGYVPYKKPVTYDDDNALPPNPRPIFMVMWTAEPFSISGSPMDKVADVLRLHADCVAVFKDAGGGK